MVEVMMVVIEVWPERIMRSTPSITHGQDKKAIQQHYEHLQTLLQCLRQYLDDLNANAFISHTQVYFPIRILSTGLSSSTSWLYICDTAVWPPHQFEAFSEACQQAQNYDGEIGLHSKSNSSRMYFREEEKIKLFFCILLIFTRGLITLLTKLG